MLKDLKARRTEKWFRCQWALAPYIAEDCRPHIRKAVELPTFKSLKSEGLAVHIKVIDHVEETSDTSFDTAGLDIESICEVGLSNIFFAKAVAVEDRPVLAAPLTHGSRPAYLIYQGSGQCLKVTQLVMGGRVRALVLRFNHDYCNCKLVEEVMGRHIDFESFVDSRKLFNSLRKWRQRW